MNLYWPLSMLKTHIFLFRKDEDCGEKRYTLKERLVMIISYCAVKRIVCCCVVSFFRALILRHMKFATKKRYIVLKYNQHKY